MKIQQARREGNTLSVSLENIYGSIYARDGAMTLHLTLDTEEALMLVNSIAACGVTASQVILTDSAIDQIKAAMREVKYA